MPDCRHEQLKYVGEQKTDDGVNTYYTCTACGEVLVLTPDKRVIGVPGTHLAQKDD